jgi:gliding motility-associated-like protein
MKHFLLLFTFLLGTLTYGQGDNCDQSLYLPDVNDYCSGQAAYTNVGSTASGFAVAACWGASQTEDVWFSFIATGTDLLVSVSGNGSNGTISSPRIALYSGNCSGTLTEYVCTNSPANDVSQIYQGGIVPGQTYLIRVSSTNGNEGTFKLCVNSYTQPNNPGADCGGAAYLCDKSTVSLSAFSGGGSNNNEPESSSCISNENNSVWYYFRCAAAGTFTFNITPSNPTQDIDFIFYELSTSSVCGSRSVKRCNASSCLNSTGSTGMSASDADITEDSDCDWGENAYCSSMNLVAGQYYAILIDNATSNSGFSLSFGGTATFTGPDPNITSTSLTICNGETVTFNGGTSVNSTGGLNWVFSSGSSPTSASGAGPHTVTYTNAGSYVAILNATDATGCQDTEIANITVSNCACDAQIGTYTADIVGVSTNNYVLCYGDVMDIQSNNDFTSPAEVLTIPPGPTYDPGIVWMLYSCPPTVGVTPTANVDVFDDPCNLGIISDYDLNAQNDMSIINSFPAGTFTDNVVYLIPLTAYSLVDNYYSYVINTNVPCYDMGTPYAVQYLPQIVPVISQDCTAGTVSVLLTGGLPAVDGSQFSIVSGSITPATASAVISTASNGGTIKIGGLTNGQSFSFQVQDVNGCPKTISGTFTGLQNAGFSYAQTAYCKNVSNPSPTISGVAGGTFTSSPAGLSISASSGVINLSSSLTGTYTVTYTTPGTSCQGTSTASITINPIPIINVADQAICQGQNVTLSGNGADTYSWTGGINNGVQFTPTSSNSYTVTGTITATGCSSTDVAAVNVSNLPGVDAGNDQTICQGQSVTLNGAGANSYSWNNGVSNGVSFTPAVGSVTYTVTGTGTGGCTGQDQVIVVVNASPVITANDVTVCPGGTVTVNASGGNTYSWSPTTSLSSGTGASVTFTAGASTAYTVTGTTAQGCSSSDAVSVTVFPAATINAGTDVTICQGPTVTLSGSGGTSYSWNNGITNGIAFTPTSGPTTYTVTGTNVSGCTATDQVIVTINSIPVINAGIDQTICPGETVTLTGFGATAYSWNNGVSNGVAFSPVVTNTYTLTGTGANGCTATDQVIVSIDPIQNVSAGADFTVCAGSPATLTGSGASTYSWNNGVLNGAAFFPNATTTYTLTGTSAAGCTNSDQVTISIEALPVVSFSPNVTSGCSPLSVNFTNSSSGSNTCTWTMSDGTILTGCSTVNNTFEAAGCYDITLTVKSLNNCISSLTSNDLICVESDPIAEFAPSANIVTEFNGLIEFTNLTIGASDYIWMFGDNSSSTIVESPSHDFGGQNQDTWLVTLVATSPLGCIDTAYSTIIYQEELIFYVPNTFTPDDDDYNQSFKPIFTAGYDPYDYALYIYNRWGEIIFESHDSEKGWDGSYGNNNEVELIQDGAYTWKLEFKVTKNDERKIVMGHVNLVR